MPVTDYLVRNAELYPDEVALVELNPDEKDTRELHGKNSTLSSRLTICHTGVRLHGVFLMKRQTDLLICFLAEVLRKEIR